MAVKSLRISSFFKTGNLAVLTPQISTLLIKELPLPAYEAFLSMFLQQSFMLSGFYNYLLFCY